MNRPILYLLAIVTLWISCDTPSNNNDNLRDLLPAHIQDYISDIEVQSLAEITPEIDISRVSKNHFKVKLNYKIADSLKMDDWRINITPSFTPSFHWTPHLTPSDEYIIAQHVFRAPAMIVSDDTKLLAIMPDLELMRFTPEPKWYMDLDAPDNVLTLGISDYTVAEHVLFKRKPGTVIPPGTFTYGFEVMVSEEESDIANPWRKVLDYQWMNFGNPLYRQGDPVTVDLDKYVEHTYDWAFNGWKDAVWQEFEIDGKRVGAPVFIVNVTQSPNYPGEVNEREFRSIWNQAWFSSLRSASGLYRYARRTNNKSLLEKANLTKELALSFPQRGGFFDGLIGTEMEEKMIDGKGYNRSKGWETYYYGNSNRNPITRDPMKAPLHILDMSWTAYLMLKWNDELEKDPRLVAYAKRYAEGLLKLQRPDGHFPAWLDKDSLEPITTLEDSPETSMSVTFLLEMYKATKEEKYKTAALKAMDAVTKEIIPSGRWEDFETYWSCCRYGNETHVGKKFERNNMYKQNTFSMYWTADALLNTYKITGEKKYLDLGQRTLDELLMCQATWQPPFMYVKTLGGFGVMNADGEWNDSRQCLFAELILDYGKELGKEEYMERGLSALKSSFIMMYCPENPITKAQWEAKYDYFGPEDYGFMMENYGHGGYTDPNGIGIGVFTIYDWGNGAASEAYNRIRDHYGDDFVK